jgi:hypothetical protein
MVSIIGIIYLETDNYQNIIQPSFVSVLFGAKRIVIGHHDKIQTGILRRVRDVLDFPGSV